MSITRHNYEEFFLLLADGELSPAQEEAVLQFTKQHPDLEEELSILMECRLDAEMPPIFPKEKLLKPILWNVDEPDAIQIQLLNLLDNELSDTERKALEQKIATEPALQLEWNLLQSNARVDAEPAPAFPKEKILKPTIWNIDEPDTVYVQMMALLDNELPPTEKQKLEQQITASKALQIEWLSLQKARLQGEAITFPNKETLYREKEQRRIGGWIRWAAAAAVVFGFGWFFWPKADSIVSSNNVAVNTTKKNDNPAPQPVKKGVENLPLKPAETAIRQLTKNQPEEVIGTKESTSSAALVLSPKNNRQSSNRKKNDLPKTTTTQQNDMAANNVANKTNTNNTIASAYNPYDGDGNRSASKRTIITGSTDNSNSMETPKPNQLSSVSASMQHNKNDVFRTASYTEDVTDNDGGNDDVVYIAGARLNKQKMRGVLRGITRSLGRTFTKSKVEPGNETTTEASRSLKR